MERTEGCVEGVVGIEPLWQREEQIEMAFTKWERACRTCVYVMIDRSERGRMWSCGIGQHTLEGLVANLPKQCSMWKRGGVQMGYVDFKKLSEEQLRAELTKVREGRERSGRYARKQSREKRIQSGIKSEKAKACEESAEWV